MTKEPSNVGRALEEFYDTVKHANKSLSYHTEKATLEYL